MEEIRFARNAVAERAGAKVPKAAPIESRRPGNPYAAATKEGTFDDLLSF